jgi:glycosyltransferase involved in cell wall biosynthesis
MTRLVLLTTFFRPVVGGVESNAERLARYLQTHEFTVTVLTKRVTRDLPDAEDLDGLAVRRIGPLGQRDGSGKWKLTPYAASWLIAHRAEYDVVACIDFRGVGLAALAARPFTGRPALFQAQTPGVFRWPVRAAYRRADAIACIGHQLERDALALGIPRERVHFLPNAIDMRQFRAAQPGDRHAVLAALSIPDSTIVCTFVGRLSLEKGAMDLMQAWKRARRDRAVLLMAGPDMDGHAWNVGPQAREFARKEGLERSVRFLGPMRDPAPILRASDLFVQPSHYEAQGLSAVEALACGAPVIASSVGGLLDFVKDGENGVLVPPQDSDALAGALTRLIDDAGMRHRLAAAARSSVELEYDEQRVFGRFAALARSLVDAKRART